MATDWKAVQEAAAKTARWAVTMTKQRITRVAARTRWHWVTFNGRAGGESRGVVDLLAVRKDHGTPISGTKRGDALQIILIQVKGGSAPWPTEEDGKRLASVAKLLHARHVLLSSWKRGTAARFFMHRPRATMAKQWIEVADLNAFFR